jgi:hypothetical protein
MRTLIIVRTHRADAAARAAYDLYAQVEGAEVIFGLDERAGPVDCFGREGAGYTAAKLDAMGLFAHPNCGWRCGDYVYYTVRAARPDYDFYWLIEPDVRIHTADINAFFRQFAGNTADLLAPRLGRRDERWDWHGTISRMGIQAYGIIYPTTRLSGRAIDHLFAERRRCSADPHLRDPSTWPNDEAFTASVLMQGGFDCSDLNIPGVTCHSRGTLMIGAVVDLETVEGSAPDGMIYHPVRDFGGWLARAESRMITVSRRTEPPRNIAGTRAEAALFSSIADACLRHAHYPGAALAPMLLAQRHWTQRPWQGTMAHVDEAADAQRAHATERKMAKLFGASAASPVLATAHLATTPLRGANTKAANPDDFDLGPPFAVGRYPTAFTLPYVYDLQARDLLSTLHIRVGDTLGEALLYAAQRRRALAVLRTPIGNLAKVYGPPNPRANPVLIFTLGRGGSSLLDRLVACATPRAVMEPDVITHLAGHRAAFTALPPVTRSELVYYAIAPFSRVYLEEDEGGRAVISFRAQASGLGDIIAQTFPQARIAFILVDRTRWATAILRGFALRPDIAANRLLTAVQSLHAIWQTRPDLLLLRNEDVLANPATTIARLLDIDVAADVHLRGRLAAVQADPAPELKARGRGGRPVEDEPAWLRAFEAAWQQRRPARLLRDLGIDI